MYCSGVFTTILFNEYLLSWTRELYLFLDRLVEFVTKCRRRGGGASPIHIFSYGLEERSAFRV